MSTRPVKPETIAKTVSYLRDQGFSVYACTILDMQDQIRELLAASPAPVSPRGEDERLRIHEMRVTMSSVFQLARDAAPNAKTLKAIRDAAERALTRDASKAASPPPQPEGWREEAQAAAKKKFTDGYVLQGLLGFRPAVAAALDVAERSITAARSPAPQPEFDSDAFERATGIVESRLAFFRDENAEPTPNDRIMAGHLVGALAAAGMLTAAPSPAPQGGDDVNKEMLAALKLLLNHPMTKISDAVEQPIRAAIINAERATPGSGGKGEAG